MPPPELKARRRRRIRSTWRVATRRLAIRRGWSLWSGTFEGTVGVDWLVPRGNPDLYAMLDRKNRSAGFYRKFNLQPYHRAHKRLRTCCSKPGVLKRKGWRRKRQLWLMDQLADSDGW